MAPELDAREATVAAPNTTAGRAGRPVAHGGVAAAGRVLGPAPAALPDGRRLVVGGGRGVPERRLDVVVALPAEAHVGRASVLGRRVDQRVTATPVHRLRPAVAIVATTGVDRHRSRFLVAGQCAGSVNLRLADGQAHQVGWRDEAATAQRRRRRRAR
jgi:hypothetical protein